MFERFHLIIVFESTFECGSRRTSLYYILRLFLLLSDEVACFAGPFLRRGCLPHSYLSFYGMGRFFLTIYRVLSVAGIE